ncbi:MAG TPA: cupin domain-containing protein [Gaiellaceae bacterium]
MIRGSRGRKRAMLIVGTALLMLAAAASVNVVPSAAVDPPPPIAAEPLTARAVFPDAVDMKIKLKTDEGTQVVKVDNPSRTVDVRYTVQPGARFPWHTHYGPVIVNIISGSLTYIAADHCDGKPYSAGQSFVDAGHGHVHSAFNPGTEPTVFIATFFEAPETGALLIPADPGC